MKCARCGKFNCDEKFYRMDLAFVVGAGRSYTRIKCPSCFQTLSLTFPHSAYNLPYRHVLGRDLEI